MYRPRFIDDALIRFLSDQEPSKVNNLFSAVPAILERFPNLNERQAQEALRYWYQHSTPQHQNASPLLTVVAR